MYLVDFHAHAMDAELSRPAWLKSPMVSKCRSGNVRRKIGSARERHPHAEVDLHVGRARLPGPAVDLLLQREGGFVFGNDVERPRAFLEDFTVAVGHLAR